MINQQGFSQHPREAGLPHRKIRARSAARKKNGRRWGDVSSVNQHKGGPEQQQQQQTQTTPAAAATATTTTSAAAMNL